MTSLVDADGLERLRGGVGGDGGDAHLAHHLHHALAERLEVIAHGRGGFDAGEFAFADEVLDRLEGQIRVDRGGAETDEHRDVVHLAGVAALDHECDGGALLGADQMVMHRRDGKQRRDRRLGVVGVAVGDDQVRAPLAMASQARCRRSSSASARPSPPRSTS